MRWKGLFKEAWRGGPSRGSKGWPGCEAAESDGAFAGAAATVLRLRSTYGARKVSKKG